MATYTDEELIAFGNSEDINFPNIDKNSSIKTNIYIFAKNFLSLNIYLSKLKAYINYVRNTINIDNIIKTVITTLQTSKNIINISASMQINDISNQNVNSINYKVIRIDEYIIEISNLTNTEWVTDNLIIQVKNSDGAIIYPLIYTINNKIIIHFIDGIKSNYRVFFM